MAKQQILKILGALAPLLAFGIIIFQVYTAADDDFIFSSSSVTLTDDLTWRVVATRQSDRLVFEDQKIPELDPLAQRRQSIQNFELVRYTTHLDLRNRSLIYPVLYVPGIKAQSVTIRVNGDTISKSVGDLPFFITLNPRVENQIEIDVQPAESPRFQGFIRQKIFFGEKSEVYKTHHRLSFKSFPRQAMIIFLLACAALTFAFFIFLDQKFELFALGLALSSLGVANAIQVGLLPVLATKHYFFFYSLHILFLTWYVAELAQVRFDKWRSFLTWMIFASIYFGTFFFRTSSASILRVSMTHFLDILPIALGTLLLLRLRTRGRHQDGFVFLNLAGVALIIYGGFLVLQDAAFWLQTHVPEFNQIPDLVCAMIWMLGGISSLGSLEKRVKKAVEDREKRLQLENELALAQEVQESFIRIGVQSSDSHDIHTIYRAARHVGGDWIAWRDLGQGIGLGILGDVAGKGLQAGLVVSACDAALQAAVRAIDLAHDDPRAILTKAIRSIFYAVIQAHPRRAMSATFIVALPNSEAYVASFGHPPTVLISHNKPKVITAANPWLSSSSFDLGQDFQWMKISFAVGDTLVIYSDGICDGAKALKQFISKLQFFYDQPLEAWRGILSEGAELKDDESLLLVRYRGDRRQSIRAV